MSKFSKMVASRVESLNEEITSMQAALEMVKSQVAKDAIQAKLEYAMNNRRMLRGF